MKNIFKREGGFQVIPGFKVFNFLDEIYVRINQVRFSVLSMYGIWFIWSAFITGLLYAMLPSVIIIEQPPILPFENGQSFAASNFSVIASALSRKTMMVN